MPYDIVETILSNIDDTKQLIQLRTMNKMFNNVINDNKMIKLTMPDYNYKEKFLGTLELYNLKTNIKNIKNINVENKNIRSVKRFKK